MPKGSEWLDVYEITHLKKRAFLLAYAELGTITHAARAAGVARKSHYNWLNADDPEAEIYKKAMQDAHEQGIESMEREVFRRAVEGIEEPVFHKGEVVGTIRKYSDLLLIFALKAANPNKYRERFEVNTMNMSNEELDARIAEYIRKVGVAAFTRGESEKDKSDNSGNAKSA